MANNRIAVKRTSTAGRTPNTTNAGNLQYIAAGELALNMTDKTLFTSDGTNLIYVGSNVNTLTVSTNVATIGTGTYFVSNGNVGIGASSPTSKLHVEGTTTGGGTEPDAIAYFKQNGTWSGSEPWALYVSGYSYLNGFRINAADGIRSLYKTAAGGTLGFAASGDDPITFTQSDNIERMRIAAGGNVGIGNTTPNAKLQVTGTANISGNVGIGTTIAVNGSIGTAGQVLTSGAGTNAYWSTISASGTVTSVATGDGLTGGPITSTGTVSVVANSGIVANATGVYVNGTYIATLSANNASYLGGTIAASYVQNTDSRTLSGNLVISGTSFTPSSNTILLGNSTQRWVLSANTGSFSGAVSGITTLAAGNTTITGFANVSTTLQVTGNTTLSGTNTYITGTNTSITANVNITGTLTTTNPVLNNIKTGYSTTVTAAGTTTLTSTSNYQQFFTGTTTQILSLPAPQTMTLGMGFFVVNNSTGNIEVRASNAAAVATILPGMAMLFVSIDLTAGNGAAGWSAEIVGFSASTGTGNVVLSSSPTFIGTVSATGGANSIVLTNATSNWIAWGAAGIGAPTTTTRSAGTKLVLYPAISATTVDYAIGVDGATMWSSLTDETCLFKWYANTTNFMSASTTLLNHAGAVNAASHTVGTAFTANSTVVNAVAYYSGTLLVANSTVSNATHLGGTVATGYQTTAGLSANVATLTSNNATNLGGVAAANYARTDAVDSFDALVTFNANAVLTKSLSANASYGTAGQVLTSAATGNVYWSTISAGGGSTYMKGGSATVGSLATEGQNIFRVNANTINYNTTFVSGENGQATGPIAVASGITLTVQTGARISIV